jgi:hypothetical protein
MTDCVNYQVKPESEQFNVGGISYGESSIVS